jgi:hypothetical protein
MVTDYRLDANNSIPEKGRDISSRSHCRTSSRINWLEADQSHPIPRLRMYGVVPPLHHVSRLLVVLLNLAQGELLIMK